VSARRHRLAGAAAQAALCLLAVALSAPARAQAAGPAPAAPAAIASLAQPAAASAHYDLARIFYGPGQRHELDRAEANALAGSEAAGKSASVAAVRFNGWLSGPGPTHAWINGTAHVGAGHPAPPAVAGSARADQPIELRRDDLAGAAPTAPGDAARFDPASQQLLIVTEAGKPVRLRAGQSEDQEALEPLAAAREPARRPAAQDAAQDAAPLPLADWPAAAGERP